MENSLKGSTSFGFDLFFCFVYDFEGELLKESRLLSFGDSGESL